MRFWYIIILFITPKLLSAQTNQFIQPLKLPPAFSGAFGDIRNNHFHSGVDIRTRGRTGYKVYSIANGYVSRIKVSPVGFGKAIYINHPNGTTAVYAHLQEFKGAIAKYVENAQYSKKTFEIELFPKPSELPVNQGNIIGLTGNSGSSGGPHLHFEVRETSTQKIINPFKFFEQWVNIDVNGPIFKNLVVYTIDSINYLTDNLNLTKHRILVNNKKYYLKDTIEASGKVGFAIEVHDYINRSSLKTGVKKIALKIDNETFFSLELEKFAFSETRYANSFAGLLGNRTNKKLYKLWKEPNCYFSGLKLPQEPSFIDVENGKVYKIDIYAWDHANNMSTLSFYLLGVEQRFTGKNNINNDGKIHLVRWNKEKAIETLNYKVIFPAKCLFHDMLIRVEEHKESNLPFQSINIHNTKTKTFKRYTLKYNTKGIPDSLSSKAYIAKINGKGYEYVGSSRSQNWVTASCNSFGKFTLLVDTISPQIVTQNLMPNSKFDGSTIRYKLIDNTGIKTYNGFIDGKWVLFEWDPKSGILSHQISTKRVSPNKWHTIKIIVTDYLDNKSEYFTKFYW
ncbi:M23 family metallopeptidase [Tenuifilum thalassicum]|uniref:M23 family metallopeptidase n=1 Tax=Tenuifilum thalassicum TaxID=2590900 RepID=A0A7D4CH37_9BACT|nr:M23 family metallopeptidase [Tenuifilum thalassicum]QKG80246.1 M23 family metallopeptidase [Tenuifilum thalassicum]